MWIKKIFCHSHFFYYPYNNVYLHQHPFTTQFKFMHFEFFTRNFLNKYKRSNYLSLLFMQKCIVLRHPNVIYYYLSREYPDWTNENTITYLIWNIDSYIIIMISGVGREGLEVLLYDRLLVPSRLKVLTTPLILSKKKDTSIDKSCGLPPLTTPCLRSFCIIFNT